MSDTIELKKDKRKLIIVLALVFVLALVIIFLLIKVYGNQRDEQERQMEELTEQLEVVKSQNKELLSLSKSLDKKGDSLKRNLDILWPNRALVYNARLRDKVAEGLELKPGDVAMMKADSSKVIITEIIVGGNQFTYYVHYLVRNPKGEAKEVSPFELQILPR